MVVVPPMFHLLHKQKGEEVLSKGGEFKIQTNKQQNMQVRDEASENKQGTWKHNDGKNKREQVGGSRWQWWKWVKVDMWQ